MMKATIFSALILSAGVNQMAKANDISAQNCEAWLDKMAAVQVAYHGAFGAILTTQAFIKVDLGKLGEVSQVGFYGTQASFDDGNTLIASEGWHHTALERYWGSSDYFVLNLGHLDTYWFNDLNREAYEGAFYVDTTNGDRFWINSESQNFLFDELTLQTLRDYRKSDDGNYRNEVYIPGASYPYGAATKTSLEQITPTANYNTYWNPQRCR